MNIPKVNSIVRVIGGLAQGNKPGTIVKVLSKPGRITDEVLTIQKPGTLYSDRHTNKVLCESITGPKTYTIDFKQACYEFIVDLKPATEDEKLRRKAGNQPGEIEIEEITDVDFEEIK